MEVPAEQADRCDSCGRHRLGNAPSDHWFAAAAALARWTLERLVNRNDCHGAYLPEHRRAYGRSRSYTAPRQELRTDGALHFGVLEQHFQGLDVGHLVGLHAIAPNNTCRWLAIDIDQHGDSDPASAESNFAAAVGWWQQLRERSFRPLLLTSNGVGGFHLLVVFAERVQSERVHAFGHAVICDHRDRGLQHAPEVFPKQPSLNATRRYGSWLRLPGRHHSRWHWTRVWNGERWLEGRAAIEAILCTTRDPSDLVPDGIETAAGSSADGGRGQSAGVGGGAAQAADAAGWAEILRGCTPGSRHPSLLRLAGHLLGHGVDPLVVEELCVLWNQHRNQPPRYEQHIRSTVHDLVRRETAKRSRHRRRNSTVTLRPPK